MVGEAGRNAALREAGQAGSSMDGTLRKGVGLGLQGEGPESLLVLGDVLTQHIPKGFCLLWAEVDGLVVMDGDFFRGLAGGQAEDELEVPDADAHLHAVGVGFAVIGGLGKGQLRLLRIGIHDEPRLLRRASRERHHKPAARRRDRKMGKWPKNGGIRRQPMAAGVSAGHGVHPRPGRNHVRQLDCCRLSVMWNQEALPANGSVL